MSFVPALIDTQTGEIFEDDESGALSPRQERRLARIDRRINRLGDRRDAVLSRAFSGGGGAANPGLGDLYAQLAAKGLITPDQVYGMGSSGTIASAASATLTQTTARDVYVKSIILMADSDAANATVLVTGLTFAGLPQTVGAGGSPVGLYNPNATRFGSILSGRKLVRAGQPVVVSLTNGGSSSAVVTGALLADEVDPNLQQAIAARQLLAAAEGFTTCG